MFTFEITFRDLPERDEFKPSSRSCLFFEHDLCANAVPRLLRGITGVYLQQSAGAGVFRITL
jgi:hypothetical protein